VTVSYIYYIHSYVYIFGINSKIQFPTFEQTELQNLNSLESLYLDGCSLDEHSLQSLGALSSLKNLSLYALSSIIPYGGKLTVLLFFMLATIRCVYIEFIFYVLATH
jgi:hypothetical protein